MPWLSWHRLEACKLLGWKTIACEVKLLDALDAELLEIDENLIRNELTALEQALAIARRKEIYELKHPETKRESTLKQYRNDTMSERVAPSFSQDTATKTGTSQRTVERAAKVGVALRDIAEEVAEKKAKGKLITCFFDGEKNAWGFYGEERVRAGETHETPARDCEMPRGV